jgi:hypothetical protein
VNRRPDRGEEYEEDEKARGCEELKVVEDNFAIAQTAIPRDGRVDAATAGNIINGIQT